MKNWVLLTVGLLAFAAVVDSRVSVAFEEKAQAEVQVVEPSGSDSFKIARDEVVRIPSGGIAGAKESVTITGPAKLTRKSRVRRIVDGQPIVGSSGAEFEITPTGRGKVVVKVKVVNPTDPENPEVTEYNFQVE